MKYLYSYTPYLFCGFILILSISSEAQSNFQPGHIITADGDSISGLIDYQNWNQNPDNISFKVKTNLAERTYSSSDIKSFAVSKE